MLRQGRGNGFPCGRWQPLGEWANEVPALRFVSDAATRSETEPKRQAYSLGRRPHPAAR